MDQHIFFLINHTWAHPGWDLVMAAASSWDLWWPFLVIGCILMLVLGGFRARAMLVAVGLAVGITDGLVVDSLKEMVGRPRPHEVLEGVRTLDLAKARPRFLALAKPLKQEYSNPGILPPHGNSFPSGHAANNFTMATVVFLFYRRRGWLAFIPAALVSYSRIYVGSHWPLDVLVSCFIGAGIALLVVSALGRVWPKLAKRWAPRLYERQPRFLPA